MIRPVVILLFTFCAVRSEIPTILTSLDWREKDVVNEPIDQMSCGACWSFATTGLVEAKLAILTGKLVKLAEGWFVDCGFSFNGCAGGNMQDGLQLLESTQFIPTQASYGLFQGYYTPDKATREKKCNNDSAINALEDVWVAYKYHVPGTEAMVLEYLQESPLPIGFIVSSDYISYDSGILEDKACTGSGRNHAALIVGYTPKYWIVKNSYGTRFWGEKGYIRIARTGQAFQCNMFKRVWSVELIHRREVEYTMVHGLFTYKQGTDKCAALNTDKASGWTLAVIPTRMHHRQVLDLFQAKYGLTAKKKYTFNYFWIGMSQALKDDVVWDDGFTELGFTMYEKRNQPKKYNTLKMAKHTTDGRWSSENPSTKLRIVCSRTVTCKKLTTANIANSDIIDKFSNDKMIHGTTARVVCKSGFVRSGGKVAKCVDGQWQLPVCKSKRRS